MTSSMEILLRLISVYTAQIGLALIFAINFFYFSRTYSRNFLSKWSISWLGLLILCGGMLLVTWPEFQNSSFVTKLFGSYTHLFGGIIQATFLAVGTYELIHNVKLSRKRVIIFGIGSAVLALILVLTYAFDESRYTERYIIRIGVRSLLIGLTYMVCGFFAIYSKRFGLESYGKKLLGIAFISYGLAQTVYFTAVILATYNWDVSAILSIYGILDLFLMAVMGIGMVMWLLEDERLKLKNANADLDSFLYSTSHDLRSPIASVLGLTHVAKMDTKDEAMLNYFDMIEARVKKLDEVIGDILSYSKNTKKEISKDQVNFNLLLKEVISDLEFNEGASKIRLDFDYTVTNETFCDPAQLRIILNNLIANAVKYHDLAKRDPYIEVKFERLNKHTKIVIADNGKGISPEHLEKIFDMFYRASTDSDGSGLGLFIVKEAAKKIDGEVNVKSLVGKGTSFELIYEESP